MVTELKTAENRRHPRFLARWHVSILCIDGQNLANGGLRAVTRDVSLGGISICGDHNFRQGCELGLCLHVPALQNGGKNTVIALMGAVMHTIYNSSEMAFRSGVRFTAFCSSDGKAFLSHNLENRFINSIQESDFAAKTVAPPKNRGWL